MIRKDTVEFSENRCGGKGTVEVHKILEQDDLCGHGLGLIHIIVPPSASIGVHQHKGSVEQYYVLKGSGIFHDNGSDLPISQGEVGIIRPSDYHGIENTSDEDMELISVHMFE